MMCIMGGSILPAIWAVELASPSPLWTLEFCVGICCFSLSSLRFSDRWLLFLRRPVGNLIVVVSPVERFRALFVKLL